MESTTAPQSKFPAIKARVVPRLGMGDDVNLRLADHRSVIDLVQERSSSPIRPFFGHKFPEWSGSHISKASGSVQQVFTKVSI